MGKGGRELENERDELVDFTHGIAEGKGTKRDEEGVPVEGEEGSHIGLVAIEASKKENECYNAKSEDSCKYPRRFITHISISGKEVTNGAGVGAV